jgi:hypothetical protein
VRRGLGAAMLLAFVGLVGSINLLAAHLRRALQTPGDLEPSQRALESFLASPLDLHDAIAWIFVAVASAFAVLAAWKFYGLDDPYPHYGALDRRRAEREDGYADLKAELIDEMTEIRDARVAEMEDFKTQLENNVRLHGQILSHRATLRQQFQQYVDYLEEVANALLSTYRDANRAARETDPPPHFHARWVLPRTTVSGAAPEVVDVEAIRRTIKETADELEASLNRVEDLYRSHIRGYQTIEDLPKEKLHRAAKISQAA